MKYTYIKSENEEVICYGKDEHNLFKSIQELCEKENMISGKNIFGYLENDIVPIKLSDIYRIYSDDNNTYISVGRKIYKIKEKLYELENILPHNFIRINKSCIININVIDHFDASWKGTLCVILKNKEQDYIARRRVKSIKERLGLEK